MTGFSHHLRLHLLARTSTMHISHDLTTKTVHFRQLITFLTVHINIMNMHLLPRNICSQKTNILIIFPLVLRPTFLVKKGMKANFACLAEYRCRNWSVHDYKGVELSSKF